MRSSKSRSRSKSNRNRPSGNIVNRVFDSSGPEGKVRGTPQQIIDKYNQLARDAQLSNDRVAAENFQQHAEHYLRMLAEAQRETEQRQQQNNDQQQNRDRQQNGGGNNGQDRGQDRNQDRGQDRDDRGQGQDRNQDRDDRGQGGNGNGQDDRNEGQPRNERVRRESDADEQPRAERAAEPAQGATDVIDTSDSDGDSGLVETPESKPKPRRRRAPKPKADKADAGSDNGSDAPPEAAE